MALDCFADVVANLLGRPRLGANTEGECAGGVAAIDLVLADLEDDLGVRWRHSDVSLGACRYLSPGRRCRR